MEGVLPETPIAIHPTRSQRQWWVPLAFLGSVGVLGAIFLIPGLEDDELPSLLVGCCLLAGTGAFLSGAFLRQRRVAESTTLVVSRKGILTVRDPSGEVASSLVGARGLSVQHAASVQRLYGADLPESLRSSGPRGAILIGSDEGTEVIRFTGQLPLEGQRRLLDAAAPFLAPGGVHSGASPTPDERYASTPVPSRLADFLRVILVVFVVLIPTCGLIAAQVAFAGNLDPHTRWLAILLWIASPIVVIFAGARLRKR